MELNVSKLKEGKVVKNYKKMCGLLEQEEKNGRSRKYQMNNWKRFFSWHNNGHKFIIDEIYDKPIPKSDLRSEGNYTKYANEIANILVYWLSNETYRTYNFSLGKLIEITYMANPAFTVGNKFREAVSNVLDLDKEEVRVFFTDIRSEFKEIIERALKILEKRSIVFVKNSFTIFDNEKNCHRLATEEEEAFILDSERKALEELKLRDRQEMFLKRKLYEFNKCMKIYLSDMNWRYYFRSYNLTIGKNALAIEKKIIDEQRRNLNYKCVERASKKFKCSDTATKLITSFIDINTDFHKLICEIQSQQEFIEKENERKKEKAIRKKSIYELINILNKEEENIERQYQYDANGYAKKSIYNELTQDEMFIKEFGFLI